MISVSSVQGVAGYRGLFAQPALRRLAVADVCARLPQGMVSLTLLLVAAQHASMTVAMAGPSGRSEHRPPPTTTRSRFGPPRSAALRRLLITAALTNAALSATEIALTAYVRHHHALWASGPLLAEISIGSIVGSVFLASRGHRLSRLLAGYAFGLGVLTGAGLYAPLLAVAAPLAGLCLGPTLATLFGAAARTAPPGYGTETQAWVNSIMNGGAAGGAALAGVASARPVLALGVAAAAAAGAAGMHHAPFGKNDRRDRGGAVPWLPDPTGEQA
jgi:hypothetical protein